MASPEPLKIAGYSTSRMSVGNHTVGQIVIDDNITVLFQMNDDGSPTISGDCLACKISKISECANLVCPDIKRHDPNASCSDAILECVALACRASCRSSGAGQGGGILILA
jgi:hypothetical protein